MGVLLWVFSGIFTGMSISESSKALVISPAMLALIAELDEFKGAWQALGSLAPERLLALKRTATIESVGSSTRIEGSKLSDQEVEHLLSGLEVRHFDSRDEQEVAGYAAVMETVFAHADAITLTENHIKQLHRDLLIYSDKDTRHRGEYKTLPNHVSAFDAEGKQIGVVFETATPFDTPRLMTELVSWTAETMESGSLHPLLTIAVFIVSFLQIHPFQDGNGRLSRILTTLLLLQAGYAYVPYSSLESVVEQSKQAYYSALRKTQTTLHANKPDWQPWVMFFLRSMQRQKRQLEEKMCRERLIADSLPPLSLRILDLIREHGPLSNSQIVQMADSNRNTVKKHLTELVQSGRIRRHGQGRGTRYSLRAGL